ncbi:MAG: hypothetical protein ACOVNY_02925 [Chitinophagaceae bacterium]
MIPTSYTDWRYCIEQQCKIQLTNAFIHERLQALEDSHNEHTMALTACYGKQHVTQLIEWFKKSRTIK